MFTLFLAQALVLSGLNAQEPLVDKTLVVWAASASLDQRGGTVLTLENPDASFDGVVFGEVEARRWMPGSDGFRRTQREQAAWPEEKAGSDEFVQIAIVYRGREIEVFRNGQSYCRYTMSQSPQPFGPHPLILFGRRHLDAPNHQDSFTGRIQDARIYDQALDQELISAMRPGKALSGYSPWAWWPFSETGLREETGRFNQIKLVGDVAIKEGCLVLGGKGATLVASYAPEETDAGTIAAPTSSLWTPGEAVPESVVRSSRLLREAFLADPYRPGYHFAVPEDMGIPGDPNGAFYQNGRYHLMYLYNRSGSGFCWGHVSSKDLLHWRHHPDAIGPGAGDEGCFSGGAFVDEDGTAYLSYWMLWDAKGIGLAKSEDADYTQWTKLTENPVIRSTEWGVTEMQDSSGKTIYCGSADPSNIWKKDGRYYMLCGNLLVLNKVGRAEDAPLSEQGDRLYLFASDNLKDWEYRHVFYERNPDWTDRSEDNMCPSFLPLPSHPEGGPASDKHLLLFISHNKGCQYYIGDYQGEHFIPESHGRMTWVDNTYFAPEALMDAQGRQIMWAWLTDNPQNEKEKGWSGVYGLPRSLWLGEDGTLRMAPVQELTHLRDQEKSWKAISLSGEAPYRLEGICGDSFEMILDIRPGSSQRCGLKVRASANGEEETLIYYDAQAQQLVVDTMRSGMPVRPAIERAPFALKEGEGLRLRVFVDKSVVEVFANDRQAITRRVYPTRPDSLGVALYCEGGEALFKALSAWRMAPSQAY